TLQRVSCNTFLEAGSPRSRHWWIQYLVKAHFPVHRWLSSRILCGRRGERSPWELFYQGTNPIHKSSPLMT
uniref:Uncharacterized protein n=1 Tax=Canis lupus familiaris TaxID=9615 RepID=A0A8C0SCN4_CANLF